MHLDNSKAIKFYVLWLFLSKKDMAFAAVHLQKEVHCGKSHVLY